MVFMTRCLYPRPPLYFCEGSFGPKWRLHASSRIQETAKQKHRAVLSLKETTGGEFRVDSKGFCKASIRYVNLLKRRHPPENLLDFGGGSIFAVWKVRGSGILDLG